MLRKQDTYVNWDNFKDELVRCVKHSDFKEHKEKDFRDLVVRVDQAATRTSLNGVLQKIDELRRHTDAATEDVKR